METKIKSHYIWEYSLKRRKVMELHDNSVVSTPLAVVRILRAIELAEQEQEHLLTFVLDAKQRIKGYSTVSVGTLDRTMAHCREIFRNAIIKGACTIILAHNHPSGDPTPSPHDISFTRDAEEAGKLLGIPLVDHIIVGLPSEDGKSEFYSMREHELVG